MLDIPLQIIPRAAVPAVAASALFTYFVAGPEIGTRVARAELSSCEREIAASVMTSAGERRAEPAAPADDTSGEIAALKLLLASPAYAMMRENPITQPLVETLEAKLRFLERGREAARTAAEAARRRIDERTARRLSGTGSICACMAARALSATRTEWAIFTGTLGLVSPAPVAAFGETLRLSDPEGQCRKETTP